MTDRGLVWGAPGSTAVVGDWNGDGRDEIGVFANGTWYLDYNGDYQFTAADKVYSFGSSGQTPVVGKW